MNNRDKKKAEHIKKMIDECEMKSILPFGFYLSSKQDHLYNFAFYVDELENYMEFTKTLAMRNNHFNNAIHSITKRIKIDYDALRSKSIEFKIICDELFSYSYTIGSSEDGDMMIDKELAGKFDVNKIKKEIVGIRVIIRKENNSDIDVCKKVYINSEKTVLYAVIMAVIIAYRLAKKREDHGRKKK